MPIFSGSAAAIVTPFTDNGVNFDKLNELIEFQISGSSDAIVTCGTTGEASTMADDEHISVIEFVVKKVNKRIPVIAGAGSNDTRHAIELSKRAEAAGADAVLSVAPYYNKTTQKGLYEHFKAIARSLNIPVVLYNIPARTNLNIDPATIQKLSEVENIVAVKECNLFQVGDIVNLCGDDFSVYSGDDNIVLPVLSLGGKGVISTMANIIPKDTHDMVARFFEGNIKEATRIQLKTLDLITALFSEVNPIPVKTALNIMGMDVGKCRLPLVEMGEENSTKLKIQMQKYGLIK